jgi:hypothetical protein
MTLGGDGTNGVRARWAMLRCADLDRHQQRVSSASSKRPLRAPQRIGREPAVCRCAGRATGETIRVQIDGERDDLALIERS